MSNRDRKFDGQRTIVNFRYLTDQDILDLIIACQAELELRSQELMEEGLENE